jgi:hypothetical protein
MDMEDTPLSSLAPLLIEPSDLLAYEIPVLKTFAWHTVKGYCTHLPNELYTICTGLENIVLTGALHREVTNGRYVYWGWKGEWIIAAGYLSSLDDRNDLVFLQNRQIASLPLLVGLNLLH